MIYIIHPSYKVRRPFSLIAEHESALICIEAQPQRHLNGIINNNPVHREVTQDHVVLLFGCRLK